MLTQTQRQELFQTMRTFRSQEKQLHQRMRAQLLSSITPIHRTAIANIVGSLAIAPQPNRQQAALQIDRLLSPAERNAVVSARNAFLAQSKTLHQQMMVRMRSLIPAGNHPMMRTKRVWKQPADFNDPGSIVLRALAGGGMHMRFMMVHGG